MLTMFEIAQVLDNLTRITNSLESIAESLKKTEPEEASNE
ncbi:hypothetical protein SEA_PABST_21 [Microbacterium phage Pabst]|nr:hypothetical protein SEA_PABST_21 [Microbacterium phage Pabst]